MDALARAIRLLAGPDLLQHQIQRLPGEHQPAMSAVIAAFMDSPWADPDHLVGGCYETALLVARAAQALGVPAEAVVGDYEGYSAPYHHAWVEVGGQPVDLTLIPISEDIDETEEVLAANEEGDEQWFPSDDDAYEAGYTDILDRRMRTDFTDLTNPDRYTEGARGEAAEAAVCSLVDDVDPEDVQALVQDAQTRLRGI
jgi:hypothetical protein